MGGRASARGGSIERSSSISAEAYARRRTPWLCANMVPRCRTTRPPSQSRVLKPPDSSCASTARATSKCSRPTARTPRPWCTGVFSTIAARAGCSPPIWASGSCKVRAGGLLSCATRQLWSEVWEPSPRDVARDRAWMEHISGLLGAGHRDRSGHRRRSIRIRRSSGAAANRSHRPAQRRLDQGRDSPRHVLRIGRRLLRQGGPSLRAARRGCGSARARVTRQRGRRRGRGCAWRPVLTTTRAT